MRVLLSPPALLLLFGLLGLALAAPLKSLRRPPPEDYYGFKNYEPDNGDYDDGYNPDYARRYNPQPGLKLIVDAVKFLHNPRVYADFSSLSKGDLAALGNYFQLSRRGKDRAALGLLRRNHNVKYIVKRYGKQLKAFDAAYYGDNYQHEDLQDYRPKNRGGYGDVSAKDLQSLEASVKRESRAEYLKEAIDYPESKKQRFERLPEDLHNNDY